MGDIGETYSPHAGYRPFGMICWGMLLYMMGLREMACACLQSASDADRDSRLVPYKPLLDAIIEQTRELNTALGRLLKRETTGEQLDQLDRDRRAHREALERIARIMGDALHPDLANYPFLSREAPRSNTTREASDGPLAGYSRYPLKAVLAEHKPQVLLAALCYAARAYAYFHRLPPEQRDFDAAKYSLNDLYQASQLACRLYYSLEESHLKGDGLQTRYYKAIRDGGDLRMEPWESPFHLWSLLQVVEIQRGHIYRQLNYLQEADRYYRHAEQRFESVSHSGEPDDVATLPSSATVLAVVRFAMVPVLLLALFERSKILFDRGDVVGSMMLQLRCLHSLVTQTHDVAAEPASAESCLTAIGTLLRHLAIAQRESIWDKERITLGFFELPNARSTAFLDVLAPSLQGIKDAHLTWWAADIVSRLGFSLWILRREPLACESSNGAVSSPGHAVPKKLERYFTLNEDLGVVRPPMARYCLAILGTTRQDTGAQFDSIERRLAQRFRENIGGLDQGLGPEQTFYRDVMVKVTENISNIVTIPRRVQGFLVRPGYKERLGRHSSTRLRPSHLAQKSGDEHNVGVKRLRSKLVILRRWQSFNPKVPRPSHESIRGGGYYLMWEGMGFVVDPGYDFLQNFYEEGFSLGDIDAVVVTHSHPDHDDDLSTLMTLVREWNEYQRLTGQDKLIKLDLFLNESAHLKFSAWLKASREGIGRVIPLPLVVWDNQSKQCDEERRGGSVTLSLRKKYHLDMEVVPAWHDDVIGKTAAVGVKFHLFAGKGARAPVGVVGFTGDTGAYRAVRNENQEELIIEHFYAECDVLVAHLGDIRLRELSTALRLGSDCLLGLLRDWFCDNDGQPIRAKVTAERVQEFLSLLVTLDLAPAEILTAELYIPGLATHSDKEGRTTVSAALGRRLSGSNMGLFWSTLGGLKGELNRVLAAWRDRNEVSVASLDKQLELAAGGPSAADATRLAGWRVAFGLLAVLCEAGASRWTYQYHLGISGIFRLHSEMVKRNRGKAARSRVFVVGELPEELSSYRHHIARLLNRVSGRGRVHAFTGDIGLHVSLADPTESGKRLRMKPEIRCAFCNYNNEAVLSRRNYHPPDKIRETCLKRLDSSMIYLCTRHDHHVEDEKNPIDFLYRPNLRLI